MIKLIRVLNSGTINYLRDMLIPGEDFEDRETLVEQLKAQLMNFPSTTFYMVAVQEGEIEDLIAGFVLAFARPTHVAVHQVWWDAKLENPTFVEKFLLRLLLWCEQNDVSEVRIDDTRTECDKLPIALTVKHTIYSINVNEEIDDVSNRRNEYLKSAVRVDGDVNSPATATSDAASGPATGRAGRNQSSSNGSVYQPERSDTSPEAVRPVDHAEVE